MAKFSCQLSSFPHVHHFISSLAPLSGKEKLRQRRSTNDKMVSPCHRAPCPAGPPCWNMGKHEASCVSPLTVQSSAVSHSFILQASVRCLQHVPVWFCRDCIFFPAPHSSYPIYDAHSGPHVTGAAIQQHSPLSLTTLWLLHPPLVLAQYSQRLSITPDSSRHHF